MPYLIKQANILTGKYDIVATNPPYLNKMDSRLKTFVNENYYDSYRPQRSPSIHRNTFLPPPFSRPQYRDNIPARRLSL